MVLRSIFCTSVTLCLFPSCAPAHPSTLRCGPTDLQSYSVLVSLHTTDICLSKLDHLVLQDLRKSIPPSQPLPINLKLYHLTALTYRPDSGEFCVLRFTSVLPLTSTVALPATMPLLSLPVELHREVLLRLDHPSLLNMTSTNQYFRTVLKTLPVTAIQDSINDFLRSIEKPSSWNISDSWAMMGKFEKTNAGFLKTADMIPCYYCRAILPSEDFGDWATQRLTEIYDGAPLAGVCLYEDDDFHYRFHLIADQEFHPTARQKARGVSVRDMYDAVIDDNKSFLAVVDSIQCRGLFFDDWHRNL